MAISYKDYIKKYNKEIQNAQDNLIKQKEQERINNMSSKEAKVEYKNKVYEKQNAINDFRNIYKKNDIVVSDSALNPTATPTTYQNTIEKDYSKKINPNPRLELIEKQKKSLENYDKFNEFNEKNKDLVNEKKQNVVKKYNETAQAFSNYQQKKLDEDDIGIYDKTLGRVIGGITSPFSQFAGEQAINENGDLYYLPSYNDLKQQKVLDSYGNSFLGKVAKVGTSALYEGGKLVTSAVLNKLAPGLGTTTYFSDMYTKQLNQAVSEGYSEGRSLAYASLSTATEFATEKLLGGTTKFIFGGNASSELSKNISTALSKTFTKNPRLVNAVANAISEGGEEFLQEFIDVFSRNITLGEKENPFTMETLENAIYSGAVGALTGAFSGATDSNDYFKLKKQRKEYVDNVVKLPTSNDFGKDIINDGKNTKIDLENKLPSVNYNTGTDIDSRLNELRNNSIENKKQKSLETKINNIKNSITELENNRIEENNISNYPVNIVNRKDEVQSVNMNNKASLLNADEQRELDTLLNTPFELSDIDNKRIEYLQNKADGKIKYPELEGQTAYENIKMEYAKYKNVSDFDNSLLTDAKNLVSGYHNTERRTKDQWLFIANQIGEKFSGSAEELKKYAIQSWFYEKPNSKENLNRQGSKYVDFQISEWLSAIYNGAGVGKVIDNPSIKDVNNTTELYVNGRNNVQNNNMIPTANDLKLAKGNIPINENLLNKYSNAKDIFSNERINQDGIVSVKNVDFDLTNKTATDIYHIATDLFSNNHANNVFINDGNKIIVTNQDIKESINKIYNDRLQKKYLNEHLSVFTDLGDVISNAKLVNQTPEGKGREKYNLWSYYYSGLKINNELYNFEFDVVSRNDGENHYRLQRIEKADFQSTLPINGEVDLGKSALEQVNNNSPVDINNIPQFEQNVKSDISNDSIREDNDVIPLKKDVDKSTNIPLAKSNDTLKIRAEKIAKSINGEKPIDVPIGKELRSWSETSTESDILKDFVSIKDMDMDKITYTPISNKKTLENAKTKTSSMSYEEGINYINAKMNDSKVDLTDLAVIDQLLMEAKKRGDKKNATDLIMNKTILGTELGQMVQQYSMIGRMTPEGQLLMFQKIVNRAKSTGDKSFEGVTITPEMVETILNTYKSDGTYTQEDLETNVEKFKSQIAEQMKSTTADKINGWRYLSMLGNPKTHIRNIVSNIAMKYTMKVKNLQARTLEALFIKDSKDRTRTFKKASQDVVDFVDKTTTEMKSIIQGEGKYSIKNQLQMEKATFNNKTLEKISKFNSDALSWEDWLFSKSAFQSSLKEYLTAKGITTKEQINNNPELIEQAKLYAVEQAEIATFRQYSKVASYIQKIENTNTASKLAIGASIPFKKTPINVAKAGVKYSPIGLIKNLSYDIVQLKNGNINASQFIDNLSQGLTGTSLTLMGYALAKAGFITGGDDDDKESKYDSQLGNQGYALKIGNNTYSLSWLSPVAIPILTGANAYKELEEQEEWDANIVIDTLAKTLDPVSEMSFISGLTDVLSSYQQGSMQMVSNMAQNATSNYALQFFPTLFSQIASTFDDKVRSTAVDRDSSFKFANKLVKQMMYKIPGLRNTLPVATDIWGEEKKQSDSILERAFNNFIAPYSKKEIKTTSLDNELKRVYKETGDTSVVPGVPQGYVKYKNENYNMNSNEYTSYKKAYGQAASKYLNNLVSNSTYKNADDETKAKMIKEIYGYSKALANEKFFNGRDINYSSNDLTEINKLKDLKMSDIQVAEYVALNSESSSIKNNKGLSTEEKHTKICDNLIETDLEDNQLAYLYSKYYSSEDTLNDIVTLKIPMKQYIKFDSQNFEGKYNVNTGKTINGSRKNEVINYVNSLNLTIPQKAILIKSKYSSYDNYNNQIINYVNGLNKSANDKKVLLKSIGFDNYNEDIVNYINSQNITKSEKEKTLKKLGFTIRDGRVYW